MAHNEDILWEIWELCIMSNGKVTREGERGGEEERKRIRNNILKANGQKYWQWSDTSKHRFKQCYNPQA